MTQYVVTGRPFPMSDEVRDLIGDLGVGASLDANLASDVEARLVDAHVLSLAVEQEVVPSGVVVDPEPQPEPEPAAEPEPAPAEQPEPDPGPVAAEQPAAVEPEAAEQPDSGGELHSGDVQDASEPTA